MLYAAAAVTVAASLSSCEMQPYDDAAALAYEDFVKNFIISFGLVNPDQDWNTASRVGADVRLTGPLASRGGELMLEVYTSRPGTPGATLMSRTTADTGQFTFDYVKGLDQAFVRLVDASGVSVYSDFVDIADGRFEIDTKRMLSRASGPSRTLYTKRDGAIYDASGRLTAMGLNDNQWSSYIPASKIYSLYTLDGADAGVAPSWTFSALHELFGAGKPFSEGRDGKCNLRRWFTAADGTIENSVEYVVGEGGSEVSLEFFYANTAKTNALGYLYYRDGDPVEKILSAPHYVLIDDASMANLAIDGATANTGRVNDILYKMNNGGDALATAMGALELAGRQYRLVYFDEAGNASYNFPAGTHIVFFLMKDNGAICSKNLTVSDNSFRYSVDWMNEILSKHQYAGPFCNDCAGDATHHNFITYSWYGHRLIGIEDEGGDDDMNDLMFYIKGDFINKPTLSFGNETSQTDDVQWILAAEDLGGTADFDFNDVVFGISYNSATRMIKVTPLAAGGTLPAQICYNGEPVGPEIHRWFGLPSTDIMYNTDRFLGAGYPVEIPYEGPGDFTLSGNVDGGNMGGFSIRVNGSVDITAPGKGEAPQMICMPGSWMWPVECTRINKAYPAFGEWGANLDSRWYDSYDPAGVINWR